MVRNDTRNKSEIVSCEKVNAHYFRNFKTDSAEQDAQLDLAKAGATMDIFGFFGDYYDTDYSKQANVQDEIG